MSEYTKRALSDLAELESVADRILDLGGISRPPVPENLVSVFDPSSSVIIAARKLGVVRALLRPDPQGWTIIVNASLSRYARRFSIFHEGFHILQRTGAVPNGHSEEYSEWLADAFAARILMPRRWLLEMVTKCSQEELSARFKVSYTALERRLKELCVN